ncbi:hypothetical protein AVEN_197449-1 [Araneus ventricosus]|uniref:Transposable element P transposase-like RNase H domain-containing protein n=1 Tax=Araneus ventricosus TaxID=182803 RepID=A0A4Y2IBJ7_ARAVE|nr:hypothetical protein AVEN_197449-1 [Araneus ventricosus]
MSESEKICVLFLDEMSIKPGYTYAADLDCIEGFTTFKQDNKDKPPYATEVLGYYFTSPTGKFSLKRLVEEAIDILQSCQLEVVSIVCDQGIVCLQKVDEETHSSIRTLKKMNVKLAAQEKDGISKKIEAVYAKQI